jgi:Ser-tRNA(Ala) deacylase AlaX
MKSYNPEMHTAEHVLNQTMVRLFACNRSFSNHLERKKSKCDYHFERALTSDEEMAVARQVNEMLSQHLEVTEEVLSRSDAAVRFDLDKLPDATGDVIRIVSIGDYDACPCIGEHVINTREVGEFVMGSTSFEDGILRVRFKLKRPQ